MDNNWDKIFSLLKSPEPPADLLSKIINRIHREKRLRTKLKFAFSIILSISSISVLVPISQNMLQSLEQSGFLQFVSLIFSMPEAILVYSHSFIWAFLESLPAASIAIFLIVIFVFLQSIKLISRNFKIISKLAKVNS